MAKAYHLVNPSTGERLEVPEGTVELGRSRSAGITIADPSLSRIHARLYNVSEGFWVEDLGSTNGTYVLGNRLGDPTHLPPGEKVQFGDVVFTLEETSEASEKINIPPVGLPETPGPSQSFFPEPEATDGPKEMIESGPMPSDPTVTLYRRKTSLVPKEAIRDAMNRTAPSTPVAPAKPLPGKYSLSDSGRIRPQGKDSGSSVPLETRTPVTPPAPKVPWLLFIAIGTGTGLLLGVVIGFFLAQMG